MHGNTHTLPCVVSCAAFVTVRVDCGVDVVGLIEGVSVEDGVVKAVVVESCVEEGVVKGVVVEDFVEEAVVDVPEAATGGVERIPGGGDAPYTAID